jgi:hypothetical protein
MNSVELLVFQINEVVYAFIYYRAKLSKYKFLCSRAFKMNDCISTNIWIIEF